MFSCCYVLCFMCSIFSLVLLVLLSLVFISFTYISKVSFVCSCFFYFLSFVLPPFTCLLFICYSFFYFSYLFCIVFIFFFSFCLLPFLFVFSILCLFYFTLNRESAIDICAYLSADDNLDVIFLHCRYSGACQHYGWVSVVYHLYSLSYLSFCTGFMACPACLDTLYHPPRSKWMKTKT